MLLLNYRPDITGGNENVIAILFDMNSLWEEFVYRRLKKEEGRFGIIIQRQQSKDFWNAHSLHRTKTIRPDIVIEKDGAVIIIDTKWKIPDSYLPADDDLKQMFVYNVYWSGHCSALVYPGETSNIIKGDYVQFMDSIDQNECAIVTACILDGKKSLCKDFAASVLSLIL